MNTVSVRILCTFINLLLRNLLFTLFIAPFVQFFQPNDKTNDFHSLVDRYQKTHSFAALTRSFSDTTQLVNKNRTRAYEVISMSKSYSYRALVV